MSVLTSQVGTRRPTGKSGGAENPHPGPFSRAGMCPRDSLSLHEGPGCFIIRRCHMVPRKAGNVYFPHKVPERRPVSERDWEWWVWGEHGVFVFAEDQTRGWIGRPQGPNRALLTVDHCK